MTKLDLQSLSSLAQIAGAIATLVIAGLTLCQSRQNAAQLREMQRSRRAAHNPWLMIEPGFREEHREPKGIFDDPPERFDLGIIAELPAHERGEYGLVSFIDLTIENRGKGPAYSVSFKKLEAAELEGTIPVMEAKEFRQVQIQVHHGKERLRTPMLLAISYENISGEVFEQEIPLIIDEQQEFIKLQAVGFSKPKARS